MGLMGSEADWAQLDPDFAAGKKALIAEDWNGAIAARVLAAPLHRDIGETIQAALLYADLRGSRNYQITILPPWLSRR
jgi:hypothetical protein